MGQKVLIPTLFLLSTLLHSCVSSKKYKEIDLKYKEANEEIQKLTSQNNTLQQQVSELSDNNKSINAQFSSYKTECEASEKQLKFYEDIILAEVQAMDSIEEIIQQAVAEFEGQGIGIEEKGGRIYVNLEDNLLYKSGSTTFSQNGFNVLKALSGELNKYPNLQVIVVGHTDNVPFKGDKNDNLNLSTQRANGVVRALVGQFGVAPERLVAAGQGKYAPVADNSTKEGRAKNRRTEIILNPDFAKIWGLVGND